MFTEEIKHRQAEKDYTFRLTQAQRYIIKELRIQFSKTEDTEEKERINRLDVVPSPRLYPAVLKELNSIRRAGVTGVQLVKKLTEILFQYNLQRHLDEQSDKEEDTTIPKIICSESLV